eukprot:scaffold153214_cov82-Attheya_sp.AAC.4
MAIPVDTFTLCIIPVVFLMEVSAGVVGCICTSHRLAIWSCNNLIVDVEGALGCWVMHVFVSTEVFLPCSRGK